MLLPHRLETLQIITLLLSIIGLGIWSYWAIKHKTIWGYAVPAITWLFHVVIFYSSLLLLENPRDIAFFQSWSSVLRLHAMFLVIGIGALMVYERMVVKE